jgi:hypothetical protein
MAEAVNDSINKFQIYSNFAGDLFVHKNVQWHHKNFVKKIMQCSIKYSKTLLLHTDKGSKN